MEIFVSAGEASSDLHAGRVIQALRSIPGCENAKFTGIGGDCLKSQGTDLWFHIRDLSSGGGPAEVIRKWPLRRRIEKKLEERLFQKKFSAALLIDNGEINVRLASLLDFFGVPVFYYIPPKVWVWRFSRIWKIAQHVRKVIGILPFEEFIYKELEIPFLYVGNPILDEVPKLDKKNTRRLLEIEENEVAIAVFPGSRPTEVVRHVPVFSSALSSFQKKVGTEKKIRILVSQAPTIEAELLKNLFQAELKRSALSVEILSGKNYEILAAADLGIIKSGTSTLEAAVLNLPMVLAYDVARSSAWVYNNIVRYRGFVGLVNLIGADDFEAALGFSEKSLPKPIVKELILDDCTGEKISAELYRIYSDEGARVQMLDGFKKVRNRLAPSEHLGASPSQAAARVLAESLLSGVRA